MGNQVQVGPELVRSNQVINPVMGLWRRASEMEMKSRVVQLGIDVSTWSMVLFSDLDVFKSRGIIRIVSGIVVQVEEASEIKNTQV